MKILFLARHFTYFRNFESVIRELAARGHRVHLAAEREESFGGREMIDRLLAQYPGLSAGWTPERGDRWALLATKVRLSIDYLRYLDPAYDTTPKLRARARERVPRGMLWLLAIPGIDTAPVRRALGGLLRACERAVPRSAQIDAFLREHDPDVVLLTPLVGVVASPQLDHLASAKAMGYPTALCVWSWDHLSSKAIVRDVPDALFVWNETQRHEAVHLHHVPAERVVVTGAQCFDQWFDRQPSVDRQAFCRKVGLPDDRPFLLYVCSALFKGSPSEALFVLQCIRELRGSGVAPISDMPVLVRPHPSRLDEWNGIDLTTERDIALWGRNPIDDEARSDYYDSLHHSAAVIGLNTSAFIEGAIAGRPVFTVLLPEHHENQEGTIHFHYLLTVGGGLLHASRSLPEHFAQLNDAMVRGGEPDERSRRFVEVFVRPHGLKVAATPIFADTVERLARERQSESSAESLSVRVGRALLTPFTRLGSENPFLMDEREAFVLARDRAAARVEEAIRGGKLDAKRAQQAEKEQRQRERERRKTRQMAQWRRGKMRQKIKGMIKHRLRWAR